MNVALYIVFAALGLIIGSFLNVVVLRLHTKTISKGRSKCMRCGHILSGKDLVPVFSYLALGGRCRYCRSKISVQYALVEITTSFVFLMIAMKISSVFEILSLGWIVSFILYAAVFSLLIAMSVYDFHHFILPWKLMRKFLVLSFMTPVVLGILGNGVSYQNFVSGFIVAFPLWAVWYFSRGRMIGFGDVQLMCGFGFLLGISGGFAAILLGFWIGAGFIFLKMILTRKILDGKTQIPFGPFLAIGAFLAFVFGINMTSFFFSLI